MTAVALAGRLAVGRLRRDRTRTGLVVGLVATAVATLTVLAGEALARAHPNSVLSDGERGDLVSPLAVAVVVVVIVAGLAGDDRGRLRSVALLDLNGARARHRRLGLLVEGLVLGAVGTALGLGVGALAQGLLVAGGPGDGQRADLVSAAAIGLAATVAASLVGTVRDRRLPVRTLLAGRRPARRPPWWAVGSALAAVALGTALASSARTWFGMSFVVPVGGAVAATGAGWLGAAALAALGPVARRTSGPLRFAASGLARNRARSGPVAALIVVVGGVAVAGAFMGRSFELREDRRQESLADDVRPPNLGADQLLASRNPFAPEPLPEADLAALRSVLPPGTVEARLALLSDAEARFPEGDRYPAGPTELAVGDPAVLAAIGLDPGLAADLGAGRAVVLNPKLLDDGRVRIGLEGDRGQALRAVAADPGRAADALPGVLVPAAAARGIGGIDPDGGVLFRSPEPLPDDLADRLAAARPGVLAASIDTAAGTLVGGASLSSPSFALGGGAEYGGGPLDAAPLAPRGEDAVRGLVLAALVAAAVVVALAIALTTVDRRVDDELLVVLGAPAGLRRRLGALQAALVSAIGGWIAVVAGIGATAIGFARYNAADTGLAPIPFVLPWDAVLGLIVALPLLAAALTALLTRPLRTVDLRALTD